MLPDDFSAFREAMEQVKPIQSRCVNRVQHYKVLPQPTVHRHRIDELEVLYTLEIDPWSSFMEEPGNTDTEESYAQSCIQHRVIRRLHRGSYMVNAEIDLHGLNSAEAMENLRAFINRCLYLNYRCVRIIHGKGLGSRGGHPVIKPLVLGWMRRCEPVLAFSRAPLNQGGHGATYALLKKNSRQSPESQTPSGGDTCYGS